MLIYRWSYCLISKLIRGKYEREVSNTPNDMNCPYTSGNFSETVSFTSDTRNLRCLICIQHQDNSAELLENKIALPRSTVTVILRI